MFRSAVARAAPRVAPAAAAAAAAAAVSVAARRTFVSVSRVSSVSRTASAFRTSKVTTSFAPAAATRFYSAAAGLERAEVESRILSLLQGLDKVDAAQLKTTSHFSNDLGLDSLDTVEVVMAIEEEFSIEIPDKDADAIHSVEQAVEYILHEPNAH